MAKGVAPPKSTGGGGFVFEDKVCAWFLAHMLSDEPPLDVGGRIERVNFQARPEGWFLDDLVITIHDDPQRRFALSIKSNTQFTGDAAPSDFVEIAWEQFLGEGSSAFDASADLIGLVTTPLAPDLRQAVEFVLSTARTGDPTTLPERYEAKKWANDTKRALFRSFACPEDLAQKHSITEADTGRLLARLRFLQFDFESTPSESEKQAIARCRAALRSGDPAAATKLWEHLLHLSADRRPKAGALDVLGLIDALRRSFDLSEVPSYADDWNRLAELTTTGLTQVRDSIGGRVRLGRDAEVNKLKDALTKAGGAVLLGPSGAGKSVVAKNMSSAAAETGQVCLWFGATSFERPDFAAFQADLGLARPLREVLRSARGAHALLVIDGLDRLFDDSAFALLGALLQALDLGRDGTPWQVAITCQTQEWPRLQDSLLHVGVPVATWHVVECEPLDLDALDPVWAAIPTAARLRSQANLRPLLQNLKILDLIASRLDAGVQVETAAWVGESSVASWYWHSRVVTGEGRRARERFTMLLAERQADELELTVPLDRFNVSELGPLDRLEADRVCMTTDRGRVGFAHDLFGDWARLHILIAHAADIARFLDERMDSPLWHRAIRLYGAHLLEHASDIAQWRSLVASLTAERGEGARDLLLESIVFAANPAALLHQVRDDLQREGGHLLRRLLGRFLAFATLPDPFYQALAQADGNGAADVAARYRYPNWRYWPPVLQFLHAQRAEFVALAPVEIARLVDLWLSHTKPGFPWRREAAELALLLGQRARDVRRSYGSADYEQRKLYYRVALSAAEELPDEVSAFALQASERRAAEEPDDAADEPDEGEVGDDDPAEPLLPKSILFDPRYDPDEPVPDPWPDGPRSRVDDDFQEAVLETAALLPLVRTRPSVAREVLLASLIKARGRFDWHNSWHESRELDLDGGRRWHPPLYIHGPFLGFLNADFAEGLEAIARLIDFASERWRHYAGMEAREYQAEVAAGREDPSPLGRMVSEWRRPPGAVLLPSESGDRDLIGDARVFGWSAGLGNPPSAVEAALMALEQYFYLELDEDRPIADKAQAVLERARSAAFLKPLCDLAKREPDLFKGTLRVLLAMPEVYEWDIQAAVQGRQHLMIGAFMQGWWFVKLAKEFHDLKHRSIDLRHLGVQIFLSDEGTRTYLSAVRERWEQRLADTPEGPFREFLQQLVVGYDIGNYRSVEHPEHGRVIVNVRAHEIFEERADERQRFEEERFLVFLPMRCRQMLEERTVLPDSELDEFWDQIQRVTTQCERIYRGAGADDRDEVPKRPSDTSGSIRALLRRFVSRLGAFFGKAAQEDRGDASATAPVETMPPEYDEARDHQVNALAGAAAVLIRNHAEWLARHPERKAWCQAALRTTVMNPPPRDAMDVPESAATWTWDCFAAEALPALWADDVHDEELRHLVARVALAPHYAAVRILFARCAEQRPKLGEDFGRLRRLVFELAHIRNRVSFVQQARHYHEGFTEEVVSQFGEALDAWAEDRLGAFIDGTLALPTSNWKEMDQPQRFTLVDEARARRHGHYFLDFRLVRAAHEWIPSLDEASSDDERREWLDFLRSAFAFSLSRVSDDADRDDYPYERDDYPYEDDHWVLDRVAAALPTMRLEDGPDDLWRAVLDLGRKAHHWSEDFLRSFYRLALQQDPVPARFSQLRLKVIDYVLSEQRDDEGPGWSYHDDAWLALVGMDGLTRSLWDARHQSIATAGAAQLERWTARVGGYGGHLAALAAWLRTDAAAPLRLRGLSWLDRALTSDDADRVDRSEDSEQAVASLLQVVWRVDEVRLRTEAAAFSAFRSLLRWLASRQNPLALELVGRLGGLAG